MNDELRNRINDLLASRTTMTLATIGENGYPQAADVYFASDPDSLQLVFVSSGNSRHAENIIREPKSAVTVHAECYDWFDIVGVQIEGLVGQIVIKKQQRWAWELYRTKFPYVEEDFTQELSRINWYCFTPRWLRMVDNRIAFGHRDEVEF